MKIVVNNTTVTKSLMTNRSESIMQNDYKYMYVVQYG